MTNVQEMWCIKNPNGCLVSFRGTATASRDNFLWNFKPLNHPWKYWYRKGFRAVKVQIRVKPKPVIKNVWIGIME